MLEVIADYARALAARSFQSVTVDGGNCQNSYQNNRYASSFDFSVPAQMTLSLALTSQHRKLQSVLFSPAKQTSLRVLRIMANKLVLVSSMAVKHGPF